MPVTFVDTLSGTRVLVLGPVALLRGGIVEAVPGQQGQILSLLAAAFPNVVSADALVDQLWVDRPPKSARTGLRVVITRLRERFESSEGSAVIHEGGSYRLAIAPEELDVVEFDRTVAAAEADLASDPGRAADLLLSALDLWRGEAFQPFGSSTGLSNHASHLDQRRREAEELLLTALLEAGRADSAATWATQFVESEPYRERRWESLMLALYQTGRQAEALQAGRRAATILRDDLGLEVGPDLRRLEVDILNQAPHLTPSSSAPVDVSVDQFLVALQDRTTALPPVTDSFVGRSEEELRLASFLESCRLVSIVGPPGVGKTRLAAQYVSGLADHRVVWLDLVELTADTILPELADQLGIRLADRPGSGAVADALDRDRTLMVFDNCEHLAEPAARLAEALLGACPRLSILATSRSPLASPSEVQLPVGPLSADSALRLLADRSPNGLEAISSQAELEILVEQLDGIPLSIELAAPALGSTSSLQLSSQLTDSIEVASGRGRNDPRHRSLDVALDWSLDLLSADDRSLYVSLGVLDGTFTGSDVAELSGRPESAIDLGLARLANQGLIQVTPMADGRTAWRQLNSIRTHARSKLRDEGRLDQQERAHARLQVQLVEEMAALLIGPDEDVAVARLQRAPNQLRSAHRWLIRVGDVESSASFSLGLWEYSFLRQHYSHYSWLDDTLSLSGAGELDTSDELLAQASLAAWARDRFASSLSLAEKAETAAVARGRPVPLAALKARFNVAVHENRLPEAFSLLVTLLSESEAQASPRNHADNLVVLAMGQAHLGEGDEAMAAASKSLELATATSNPTSISWAQVGVGSAQLLTDPVEAARSFSAAGRLAGTVRNHWVRGMALAGLVGALRRQGRFEQSRVLLGELVELWGRAHAIGQQWRACQEAVVLLVELGEWGAAARLFNRLDLADHVPPMLPDDAERIGSIADELRRFDVITDESAGLWSAVSSALRPHS